MGANQFIRVRLCVLTVALASLAGRVSGFSVGDGLIGFYFNPYRPVCAHACVRSLTSYMLSCSDHDGGDASSHHGPGMTSADCRAGDTAWLTTLAWCVHDKCEANDVETSVVEAFWEDQSTQNPAVQPKWDYGTAYYQIDNPPSRMLMAGDETINATVLVNEDAWTAQYNALSSVYREIKTENKYGIILVVVGFVTPVVLTWASYIPYMTRLLDVARPYVVYPSTFGSRHLRPLPFLLGNAPLMGELLFTLAFLALNAVLTGVNYESRQPHAWYADVWQEIMSYIFYRTGVFAFALSPLVLLLSSRNNILLWLTNWSHTTYLTLHRWVARIFTLQVLLHSVLAVVLYKRQGTYAAMEKELYWIWGIVATIAVVVLACFSGVAIRRRAYELFLASHVVLSVLVLVASWYHIVYVAHLDGWGYLLWLYAAFAVWAFDRAARVARVCANGIQRAIVTDLGHGYSRVDLPHMQRWTVAPGSHVFAYFPTLTRLRPWENHPFSAFPTALLDGRAVTTGATEGLRTGDNPGSGEDSEKQMPGAAVLPREEETGTHLAGHTSGLTLFVKRAEGATGLLRAQENLVTLLDGPYGGNGLEQVLRCDRILLIGGGIGITSLLPWTMRHLNMRICWSVKEEAACLVRESEAALSRVAERLILVGERLDIHGIIAEEESRGWGRVGVVVSGPAGLCDGVRAAVVAAGKRRQGRFILEEDAYAW